MAGDDELTLTDVMAAIKNIQFQKTIPRDEVRDMINEVRSEMDALRKEEQEK